MVVIVYILNHIPEPKPSGSIRSTNVLSSRFVDARYNLASVHCSQVSMSMLKIRQINSGRAPAPLVT
jgi:hypothetical protein